MKLSISTSWDFVSGKNTTQEGQLLLASFGSLESYLQYLKDLGVTNIELRRFATGLTENDVYNICDNLKKNHFSLTVHGEIFEYHIDQDLNLTFPWLQAVVKIYNDRPLLVVVHPIAGQTKSQDHYRNLTVRKIADILEATQREHLNVQVALEIMQNTKTITSPCYTYDGVLDIVTEINADNLGICFDFGHTWSNIRRGLLNKTIPDAFLNRVIHAHIYDLSPNYKTHWPLMTGEVPVAEYIDLLATSQYTGVFNLELEYHRFNDSIDAKQAIKTSLQKLGNIVKIIG